MVLSSSRDTRCLACRPVGDRRFVLYGESSALLTVWLEHTECVLTCIMAIMCGPDLAALGSWRLLILSPLALRKGMGNQVKVWLACWVLLGGLSPGRGVALEDRARYCLVRTPTPAEELIGDLAHFSLRLGHLAGWVHSCLVLVRR